MKKILSFILALALLCALAIPVFAAEGNVTYSGNAGKFVFAPGSAYSITDLFPNFKDVMPGDRLTQEITVKNQASNGVKVKIYMRSLGAHADSVDFLSQLRMRVEKSAQNKMEYMFDASADQTAQLSEWVLLGTLYSGGEVNLNVILEVPVELENAYSKQIGLLDWEFKVEEFPIESDDPMPPTGGSGHLGLWCALLAASGLAIVLLLVCRKRRESN